MTFEEWWAWSPLPQNAEQLQKLQRETWNAAITSSLNAVDAVNESNIDENDVFVYIYEDLKKLLTS